MNPLHKSTVPHESNASHESNQSNQFNASIESNSESRARCQSTALYHRQEARRIAAFSLAENTRIAYRKGWQRFVAFCIARGYAMLPASPQTVAEFLVAHATAPAGGKCLSLRTVELCCNAINRMHAEAGLARPGRDPHVADVLRGLRRLNGTPPRRVKALREQHIQAMLQACECASSLLGLRDAAVLALGFAGALRRSEICNLRIDDVEIINARSCATGWLNDAANHAVNGATNGAPHAHRQTTGMFIHIRRSKTDPHGKGEKIAVPDGHVIHPLRRVDEWLTVSGLRAMPGASYLFQSMRRGGRLTGRPLHPTDVPRIVKHYAARIGIDPRDIAGHSLRAGFVTSAAAHNARLDKIMAVTRHRQPATVLKYIRDADAFCHHAGANFL